ncbi:2-oxoacid ferredoxin oxidoreductase [Candidatus Woesearchaeota archaeon]|jgi:2-oxoglutarate/2-oxoacid ferredoxin oxidoreductase subunit beta|nr:2-oxoacid ferredoxin oxidoreductase [Candidatus Woesearchaeota archaeon]MBT6518427.1 2-oxoacid ferredoxin oxidoreductase [Candidatus Woesearchaeota archaeon]MBT7366577.1 2-oxoacid ferredoxin oxidoreductase [Candidatus Woesearchaeota archaeon]
MVDASEYNKKCDCDWCPGCGNFSVMVALKNSLARLGIKPHESVLVSGIGCSSKTPHWMNMYGFHGIHGRALPIATGVKLANSELTVVAAGGDGDGYGIGLNHFMQSCKRNINLTYIVHNNRIYGLTTGQASPTTNKGTITRSTPFGNPEEPINPLLIAISSGATFVARGFSGNLAQLQELVKEAIAHKGFAFIDVLMPCVTFNRMNSIEWYRERVSPINSDHDFSDKEKALSLALKWNGEDGEIPTGIFYKIDNPTYSDGLPQLSSGALVKKKLDADVSDVLKEFM